MLINSWFNYLVWIDFISMDFGRGRFTGDGKVWKTVLWHYLT